MSKPNSKPIRAFEETKAFSAASWLYNYPGVPWQAVSALGYASASFMPWLWIKIAILIAATASQLRGTILSASATSSLTDLQEENRRLRDSNGNMMLNALSLAREGLTEIVRKFAREAHLSSSDRITIYMKLPTEDTFTAIARHSDNPEYSKIVRDSYPSTQGIIAKAWSDGRASYTHETSESDEDYCNTIKSEFGIPISVAKKIRMKSRCLVAAQLENTHSEPKAVVVVESLLGDIKRLDEVVNMICSQERPLTTIIQVIQSLQSSPKMVAEEGF